MTELSLNELKMLAIIQDEHVTNVELAERLGMAPKPLPATHEGFEGKRLY